MEDIMIDDDDVMLDFERKKIICDNFVFICFVYIFESLISIICFYLFYKFKFGDKNNKIYEIIEFSLLGILFLSYIFLYLITVLNGEKRIDFPHFEARVYWQVSICIFYLLLSFYYYFNKTSDKIYIYILFSIISLLTYFFLTFFTKRKNDNWDRLWIYMIYLYLEIVFSMITLFLLKIEFNREQLEIIDDGKL